MPDVDYAAILDLNKKRNILAHGHYDQDLFSNDFKIVGRQKNTLMTIMEIHTAAVDAEMIRDELRSDIMSHFYRIEDLDD